MGLDLNRKIADIISGEIPEIMDEVVSTRRYLHMNPEIGFDTHNTEEMVKKHLEAEGIEILPAKMGVFGLIKGKDSSRMVALRADMDALCLQEENDVPYKSQCANKMHACGHDGHTSMLLGAAKLLQRHRDELPTDVLLVFQPAEEGPNLGGARVMLADLQERGLDDKIVNFFGLHLFNDYPVGTVGYRYGALSSSTDEYYIKIIGKGGHAGQPEKTVDALSVGAKVVSGLESYMSRRMDPFDSAICSTGIFQSGSAINIVAETANISGTIRCQRDETREIIIENLEKIVKGTCDSFGATYHLDIVRGLPALINDVPATDYAKSVAEELIGAENVFEVEHPMMGAEDFAYFAKAVPSSFMWLGSGNAEKGFTYLAHHPKFDFDEDAMATGIKILCGVAMNIG